MVLLSEKWVWNRWDGDGANICRLTFVMFLENT